MPSDLRTRAIVLRRTNYGESDRILNLITPEGKIAVLARGARKEKSRLAGGIELFSVADVVIHQGRGSLGTLTSAQMLKFHSNILTDLSRLELASQLLKKIDRAAEQIDDPGFFDLLQQALGGLDQRLPSTLVQAWFQLNLARISGEEINLLTDVFGDELSPDLYYYWDGAENALRPDTNGIIGANEIKFARLILAEHLAVIFRIAHADEMIAHLDMLVRSYL